MPDHPQTPQTPADWYPDPENPGGLRYWDGTQWTEHRHQAAPPQAQQPPAQASPLQGQQPPAGQPQPFQPAAFGQAQPAGTKTNGFAIAALVLGIIGVSVLAIIFGFVGRNQIKKSNGRQTGRGMATAGIALGFAWLAITAVFFTLGATGALDETNKDEFKGSEREVAALVDRLEKAFDDNDGDLVCNELFTSEWASLVATGAGKSCDEFISETDKDKVQADLIIKDLTVTGDRATAKIEEDGDDQEWTFQRVNGDWRVSNIAA